MKTCLCLFYLLLVLSAITHAHAESLVPPLVQVRSGSDAPANIGRVVAVGSTEREAQLQATISEADAVLIGSAIAFVAAILVPLISYIFDIIKSYRSLKELACIARAEHLTLKRHVEANLIKLKSLRESKKTGERVDYLKLKYLQQGLTSLEELRKIYSIKEKLSQDVSRMLLFSRNNEIEIDAVMGIIFDKSFGDEQKWSAIENLIARMEFSKNALDRLVKELEKYAKSPIFYKDCPIDWPDSLFSAK